MLQENTDSFPLDESLSLEQIVSRFERDWQGGEPAAFDAYLRLAAGRVDRRALLVALVRIDLEHRLQSGLGVRVESHLERYPEISSDTTALLGLIATEYPVRQDRGQGERGSLQPPLDHFGDQAPLPGIAPLESRVGFHLHQPGEQPRWAVELSARVVDDQDRVAASLLEGSARHAGTRRPVLPPGRCFPMTSARSRLVDENATPRYHVLPKT